MFQVVRRRWTAQKLETCLKAILIDRVLGPTASQQLEADVEVMREEHSAALGELDARLEQRNADLEEVRPRLQQRSA